jgi:predicted transcriptional regulator
LRSLAVLKLIVTPPDLSYEQARLRLTYIPVGSYLQALIHCVDSKSAHTFAVKTALTKDESIMSLISKTLENMINETYQDGRVSVVEYTQLRDEADRRMDAVIREFGLHNNLTALQKAMDVVMQLTQTSIIDAKKAKLTDTGEAIVKDAIIAQIEYVRAGAHLALKLL